MAEGGLGKEYGIEKVPESARNYGFWDTVFLWFGGGVNTGSWWMGGIMATFGFGLAMAYTWIIIPIIAIPWVMLGYIGYKHGISTASMTRASLGIRGSAIPSLFQTVVMAGWCSVNTFLAAISCTFIFNIMWGWQAYGSKGSAGSMILGIAIIGVLQGVFATAGHKIIKYMEWVSSILLIGLGLYMTYVVFHTFSFHDLMNWKNVDAPYSTFAVLIDILVGFLWSWTHIGDFGRFAKSGKTSTVGAWLGINIGQGWFFVIGAIGVIGIAIQSGHVDLNSSDPSTVLSKLGLGWMAFLIIIFCSVNTNAMNIYTASMGLANLVSNKIRSRSALLLVSFLQFLLCFVPLLFPSFLDFFTNFLNATGGLFAPFWTLVLVDYFFVRRGHLSDEIFDLSKQSPHWYKNGFNMAGLWSLIIGAFVFYFVSYGLPNVANVISATIPSVIITSIAYIGLSSAKSMKVYGAYNASNKVEVSG